MNSIVEVNKKTIYDIYQKSFAIEKGKSKDAWIYDYVQEHQWFFDHNSNEFIDTYKEKNYELKFEIEINQIHDFGESSFCFYTAAQAHSQNFLAWQQKIYGNITFSGSLQPYKWDYISIECFRLKLEKLGLVNFSFAFKESSYHPMYVLKFTDAGDEAMFRFNYIDKIVKPVKVIFNKNMSMVQTGPITLSYPQSTSFVYENGHWVGKSDNMTISVNRS